MDYFYGPVYSRRLGFSLGVDLLPGKICSFDCLYCQVGKTPRTTRQRFSRVNIGELKNQLKNILKIKPHIDYITLSGSGEPTLHKNLDKIISAINAVTHKKYPVAVITNSSLLYDKKVRAELKNADLIIPSLDAPNETIFKKINKPVKGVTLRQIIDGIIQLKKEFKGEIWLEIMIVKNINDNKKCFFEFKKLVEKINPDKVHINLPTRPAPHAKRTLMPSMQRVEEFKRILGKSASVVISRPIKLYPKFHENCLEIIKNSLHCRPQTIDDLACALQLDYPSLTRSLTQLLKEKKVKKNKKNGKVYFVYDH